MFGEPKIITNAKGTATVLYIDTQQDLWWYAHVLRLCFCLHAKCYITKLWKQMTVCPRFAKNKISAPPPYPKFEISALHAYSRIYSFYSFGHLIMGISTVARICCPDHVAIHKFLVLFPVNSQEQNPLSPWMKTCECSQILMCCCDFSFRKPLPSFRSGV